MKSKDQQLLEEAYQTILENESMRKNYFIFVVKSAAQAFKDYLDEKGYSKRGVKVLVDPSEEKTTAAILIPKPLGVPKDSQSVDSFDLERELHDNLPNESKKGFWGQYSTTYPVETWTEL